MKELFLQELRRCNQEILALPKDKQQEAYEIVYESMYAIYVLNEKARRSGFASLEDAWEDINIKNKERLEPIILAIFDGATKDFLEEKYITYFFASNMGREEGLQYLVILSGAVYILEKYNSNELAERLRMLIPYETLKEFDGWWSKKIDSLTNLQYKRNWEILVSLYDGELAVNTSNEHYFEIKLLDTILKGFSDENMRAVIREMDNIDIANALAGLSGKARERVLTNMSRRLALMIALDIDMIDRVYEVNVAKAVVKMLNLIAKLLVDGSVRCDDGDTIMAAIKMIFDNPCDSGNSQAEALVVNTDCEKSGIDGLFDLMEEYFDSSKMELQRNWDKK